MSKRHALILDPTRCALVMNECQAGVVGEDSVLPALACEVGPMLANLGRLAEAARRTGAQIVHATFETLADNQAAARNNPLFGIVLKHTSTWTPGSKAVQVVPQIGVGPKDLIMPRHHGLSPSRGTEMLSVLRNLGVETLIVAGVSLNVAVPSVAVDAVNEGFRVVVPTDGVAGTPAEYAAMVLKHTLAMVATLATCDEIADAWRASTEAPSVHQLQGG